MYGKRKAASAGPALSSIKVSRRKRCELEQSLYEFVKEHIKQHDLDRGIGMPYCDGFGVDDIDAPLQLNKDQLHNKVTEGNGFELLVLDALQAKIEREEILLVDKESMCPFTASGFAFNKEGKLVCFNER